LPQEDVGGHVGVSHTRKSSANAAMAITAAKRQAVAALRYADLAVANFATPFGGVGESCSLSKNVAKWYKRLKDC
jgi:hypothetical protein